MNEPCAVWFAVVGVRVGMNFLRVLHSVRMVWLRHGSVAGVLNEPCTVWFAVVGVRVWIEFSWCSTQCAHGFVKVWWCQWSVLNEPCTVWFAVGGMVVELGFLCVLQHCAVGFVKIWWCQWMCWMSRAQCDLLLVVWVLAMAWDSVFLRARSSGVSFG